LRKGILRGFDPDSYTATVQLAGSPRDYLEDIKVARNLPASEMIPGRQVALVFFAQSNAREALLLAVYS
jgi:hypothetical protein